MRAIIIYNAEAWPAKINKVQVTPTYLINPSKMQQLVYQLIETYFHQRTLVRDHLRDWVSL